VAADGRVLGVLSLSHVRHCRPEDRAHKKVRDIMLALGPDFEISPQAGVLDALHKMDEADSGRLIVVDEGRMVGLITRTGIARMVQMKSQLAPDARLPEKRET